MKEVKNELEGEEVAERLERRKVDVTNENEFSIISQLVRSRKIFFLIFPKFISNDLH